MSESINYNVDPTLRYEGPEFEEYCIAKGVIYRQVATARRALRARSSIYVSLDLKNRCAAFNRAKILA